MSDTRCRVLITNERIIAQAECYRSCDIPDCPYSHIPTYRAIVILDATFAYHAMAHRFVDDQTLHDGDQVEIYD